MKFLQGPNLAMFDGKTADFIRQMTMEESEKYLAMIKDDHFGALPRSIFDDGEDGWIYAV